MVVTDRRIAKLPLVETLRLALEGGADAVQLRERDLEAGEIFALSEKLRRVTSDAGAALIINHRTDVALAVGADGVHLGWRSLGPKQVRELAGDRLRVGVSCHSEKELHAAAASGADYAILGPVFSTPSKHGRVAPLGLARMTELVSGRRMPVIAIGGIQPENVGAVRQTGVAGVAVIAAVMASENPREAARRLAQSDTSDTA